MKTPQRPPEQDADHQRHRGKLPWVFVFSAAVLLVGTVVRLIKAHEFRQHNPEMFAFFACRAIMTVCATMLGMVLPVLVHPLVMPLTRESPPAPR